MSHNALEAAPLDLVFRSLRRAEGLLGRLGAVQNGDPASTRVKQYQNHADDENAHERGVQVSSEDLAWLGSERPEYRLTGVHSGRDRGDADEAHGDRRKYRVLRFAHIDEERRGDRQGDGSE